MVQAQHKKFIIQVLIILFFLLQPIFFPSNPAEINHSFFSINIFKSILTNAFLVLFFYLNYYIFIPKFYFQKRYFLYITIIILGLCSIIAIPEGIFHLMFRQDEHLRPSLPPFEFQENELNKTLFNQFQHFFSSIDHIVFLFVSVVFFSLLLQIRNRWYRTEKAMEEAKISFLLSQINPHFLFNALNSIYALSVKEKATHSSEAILKLSGMMRFIVTDNNMEWIFLEKEIEFLKDYIGFQKLRLDKSVKLNFEYSGNFSDKKIAPLLFIPFIENAFKHGVNPDEDSEIFISINLKEKILNFVVENNNVFSTLNNQESSGLGIENTKNRLMLIYPKNHFLNIIKSDKKYTVHLTLFLE